MSDVLIERNVTVFIEVLSEERLRENLLCINVCLRYIFSQIYCVHLCVSEVLCEGTFTVYCDMELM